jgi:hypothetical protein
VVKLSGEPTPDELPPAELLTACDSFSWLLSSLTRFSRFCNLSITLPTSWSVASGAKVFDALALLARPRAHLGGRSSEGKTQAMFARRQLEHAGDCLSQRTFRLRHTTQLRDFDPLDAGARADDGVLALFSEPEAETCMDVFAVGTCDNCCIILSFRSTCIRFFHALEKPYSSG